MQFNSETWGVTSGLTGCLGTKKYSQKIDGRDIQEEVGSQAFECAKSLVNVVSPVFAEGSL